MSLSRLDLQHSHLDHLDHLAPRPVSWLIVWVGFFLGFISFYIDDHQTLGVSKDTTFGMLLVQTKGKWIHAEESKGVSRDNVIMTIIAMIIIYVGNHDISSYD